MDDIFAGEVEEAQNQIQKQSQSRQNDLDIPEDLQEQLETIESLAAMNPEILESEEYKDLMAKIEKSNSSQASDEDEEDEEDEEESDEEDEESDEDDEDEDEDEDDEDIDDVFGTITKNKKKAKKVEINFDVPDEMANLLKKNYGINDASTFFASVDTWRTQAQEGSEAKNQLDSLINDIQSMPPDLRTAIQMWSNGEDHTSVFTQGLRLDFASDFESQDIESLVEHYLPEQYSELINQLEKEKISEEDFDDKIELLARSTKKMFNGERDDLIQKRADYTKQQEQKISAVKQSANSSVDKLSKDYPNFSKSELARVKSYLVEGKFESLIYNSDGTYKDDAAENIANMMFGKKMRETIEKLAMRRGESRANQRIVESSAKSVGKKKSSNASKTSAPNEVQHLGSVVVDNDPYA